MSDKLVRIKNRYDSAINWYTDNPILAAGEIGIDSTHNHIKIGDGSTDFFNLPTLVNKVIDTGIVSVTDKSQYAKNRLNLAKIAYSYNALYFYINASVNNSNMTKYVGDGYGLDIVPIQMYKSVDIYVEGYGEITINLDVFSHNGYTICSSTNFDYSLKIDFDNGVDEYELKIHTLHSLTDANNDDCIYVIVIGETVDYVSTGFVITSVKPTEKYIKEDFIADSFDYTMIGKKVRYKFNLK